jgi:hypothetical protein
MNKCQTILKGYLILYPVKKGYLHFDLDEAGIQFLQDKVYLDGGSKSLPAGADS